VLVNYQCLTFNNFHKFKLNLKFNVSLLSKSCADNQDQDDTFEIKDAPPDMDSFNIHHTI